MQSCFHNISDAFKMSTCRGGQAYRCCCRRQALALAIGSVRDRAGFTPPEAVDALVDALMYADNSSNIFDDSHMRAAHLAALGQVRLQSQEVRASCHLHVLTKQSSALHQTAAL